MPRDFEKIASDAERRPDQKIAPLVLKQFKTIGDSRQIRGLHIGGEIGGVIGEQPRIEDIAPGDRRPLAIDQRVPGEPPHRGGGENAIVGGGAWLVAGTRRICGAGRVCARLRIRRGEYLRDIAVKRTVGLRAVVEQARRINLVERHVMRVLAQLVDLLGRKAAALEQHRRRREIG